MTLRDVVALVVEEVERYLALHRLRVWAYAFESANSDRVLRLARKLNGSAGLLTEQTLHLARDCDVLVADRLPLELAAQLALGTGSEPVCRACRDIVLRGGRVLIADRCAGALARAPEAYRALYAVYWRLLREYGFVFLDQSDQPEARVYTQNVLTQRDVMAFAGSGELQLGRGVVVTPLAAETAKRMGIRLRPIQEGGSADADRPCEGNRGLHPKG